MMSNVLPRFFSVHSVVNVKLNRHVVPRDARVDSGLVGKFHGPCPNYLQKCMNFVVTRSVVKWLLFGLSPAPQSSARWRSSGVVKPVNVNKGYSANAQCFVGLCDKENNLGLVLFQLKIRPVSGGTTVHIGLVLTSGCSAGRQSIQDGRRCSLPS